jgi:hypothetical protein
MNSAYSLRDTTTAEGVHQPTTSLRSGGPGSLIPWDTLGYQGRNFTGKGPTVSDIEKLTGHPAMEPIRAYAGLASASNAEARAALAVRDLQREGGFKRKDLLVVSTTGSGWVDPARYSPGRPTSTPCSGSSPTTATRAARKSSLSTRTGGSSGSPTTPLRRYPRQDSPGRAPGSCT